MWLHVAQVEVASWCGWNGPSGDVTVAHCDAQPNPFVVANKSNKWVQYSIVQSVLHVAEAQCACSFNISESELAIDSLSIFRQVERILPNHQDLVRVVLSQTTRTWSRWFSPKPPGLGQGDSLLCSLHEGCAV
jgi:hypothetical protein